MAITYGTPGALELTGHEADEGFGQRLRRRSGQGHRGRRSRHGEGPVADWKPLLGQVHELVEGVVLVLERRQHLIVLEQERALAQSIPSARDDRRHLADRLRVGDVVRQIDDRLRRVDHHRVHLVHEAVEAVIVRERAEGEHRVVIRQVVADERGVSDIRLRPRTALPRIGVVHLRARGGGREVAVAAFAIEGGLAPAVVEDQALRREPEALLDEALREEHLLTLVVERLDPATGVAEEFQRLLGTYAIPAAFQYLERGIDEYLFLILAQHGERRGHLLHESRPAEILGGHGEQPSRTMVRDGRRCGGRLTFGCREYRAAGSYESTRGYNAYRRDPRASAWPIIEFVPDQDRAGIFNSQLLQHGTNWQSSRHRERDSGFSGGAGAAAFTRRVGRTCAGDASAPQRLTGYRGTNRSPAGKRGAQAAVTSEVGNP